MPIAHASGEDDTVPMINPPIPSSVVFPKPRSGSPEKWLALIGFVVVTVAGVILIGFPR
jgi:hypothetical protein